MRLWAGCSLAGGCWRRWGNDEFGDGVCPFESFWLACLDCIGLDFL